MAEYVRQNKVLINKCKSNSQEVDVSVADKCQLCLQRDEWIRNMTAGSSNRGRNGGSGYEGR
jgi:hypothetical protein